MNGLFDEDRERRHYPAPPHSGDWFFDKFEGDFDKNFKRAWKFGFLAWVLSVLGSLAILGVVIWAIITLVTHFTG